LLEEGRGISFEFVPLSEADRRPTVTFKTGEAGWGVQPEAGADDRTEWMGFKISGRERQQTEPPSFGAALMDITPVEVSAQIIQGKAVWKVNGKEVGRFDVALPVPLLARVSDGRMILFNYREVR
jgi:hypothetical protein